MNSTVRTILFWLLMILLAVVLWKMASTGGQSAHEEEPDYSKFLTQVQSGNVERVTIYLSQNSAELQGEYHGTSPEKSKFKGVTVANTAIPDVTRVLQDKNVPYTYKEVKNADWLTFMVNFAPLILLVAFWIFMMRQMQAGGNKALSFGKSRARLLTAQQKKATFKDVAGIDEAKEELYEIIDFLKDPQKFQKLGGRIPKGVLLVGPPGTGKTLLARAIAGEANVPFFSISGSDFVEMFVGVGASRVRDLFEQGKKNAPCIIFIDEIDAVGRHRGAGLGGGHDEREQTLNALLVEMDGFESNEGVILIAATNRPDVLDPALLRPGRFDRRVVVPRPDVKGREEILRVHTRKVPLSDDVDLSVIARGTPGFSGADVANLVNESALWAARQNRKFVTMVDFEMSKDKVLMGVERRSMILSDEEKRNTAYHEAGHALVAAMTPGTDPLHKVTIIPRGMALGVTMQLPIDDKHTYTKEFLESQLAVLMGGRAAEAIVPPSHHHRRRQRYRAGHRNCASDGLRMGHEPARTAYVRQERGSHLPRPRDRTASRLFRRHGDQDRRGSSQHRHLRIRPAHTILETHRDALERVAQALLHREVLDATELKLVIEGKPLPDKPPAPPPSAPPVRSQRAAAYPASRAAAHPWPGQGRKARPGIVRRLVESPEERTTSRSREDPANFFFASLPFRVESAFTQFLSAPKTSVR